MQSLSESEVWVVAGSDMAQKPRAMLQGGGHKAGEATLDESRQGLRKTA